MLMNALVLKSSVLVAPVLKLRMRDEKIRMVRCIKDHPQPPMRGRCGGSLALAVLRGAHFGNKGFGVIRGIHASLMYCLLPTVSFRV